MKIALHTPYSHLAMKKIIMTFARLHDSHKGVALKKVMSKYGAESMYNRAGSRILMDSLNRVTDTNQVNTGLSFNTTDMISGAYY